MDGIAANPAAVSRGGLFLLDLDAPPPPPAPSPEEEGFDIDALLEEARVSARQSGFAAGQLAGLAAAREEATAQAAVALTAIAARLSDIATETANQAAVHARALAGVVHQALLAALPAAAARDAAGQTARAATAMARDLSARRSVRCHVAPDMVEPVQRLFSAKGVDMPVTGDAALTACDVRLAWEGGGAESLLAHRQATIHQILSAFGLADGEEK